MSRILEEIEVGVPLHTAYNQWTQFEEFPQFMEGVESVTQVDDAHMHWIAEVAGVRREWNAEITEQTPDQRVAWTATDGAENAGAVTFHEIDDGTTRVVLQLDYEPDGLVEKAGDVLGIVKSRATGDLERFKAFIEHRGAESGAWRGEIEQNS